MGIVDKSSVLVEAKEAVRELALRWIMVRWGGGEDKGKGKERSKVVVKMFFRKINKPVSFSELYYQTHNFLPS